MTIEQLRPAAGAEVVPSKPLSKALVGYAVVAAGARFVPVPFLDDIVKDRANRTAIGHTLKRAGSPLHVTQLKPLYASGNMIGFVLKLPFKLLLFPLRKFLRILGAIHGVPTDMLSTLLLTRAVSRHLDNGGFASADKREVQREAKRMKRAFDRAFSGSNWRFSRASLATLTNKKSGADVDAVYDALKDSDIQRELAAFDARFDAAWIDA